MTILVRSMSRAMSAAWAPPGPLDDWSQWQSAPGTVWLSQAGIAVTPATALTVSTVWGCTRVIGETMASIPLVLYERRNDDTKRRATEQPLYRILHDDPNLHQTSMSWREMLTGHTCLRGNGLSQIISERGQIVELVPLHPDRVKLDITESGTLRYIVRGDDGRDKPPLLEDEVFHLRGPSDNGLVGMSVVGVARDSIGLAQAAESHGNRTFRNGASLSGVLQHPGRLSPEAAKRIRESWDETYSGVSNAGRTAVLWEDMKWQSVGMSSKDAEWLALRQFQVEEAARWFRMPLHMIGHTEKQTTWGCLPGDTMVFTTRGPRPIADVREGDEVWSLGEGGMTRSRVTAQQMTGVRPVRTIKTIGRTLRLTDNHRVLVRRYRGRGIAERGSAGWVTLWVSADEILRGDYMAVPHGLPSEGHTTAPNGRNLTVAAMELCGLYIGDGSRDKGRVEIAHERDADHMPYYRDAITREFGARPYTDQRGTRTRFSSADAIALLECGFTGTAHTKRVPSWVFALTRELQIAFLRGYLDADGSVQRGRIVYSSASRDLLEDVRHLCIQVGVPVGRVSRGRAAGVTVIRGRAAQSTEKYQLNLSGTAHNHRIGSNSPRKASRFRGGTERALCYDDQWTGGQGKGRRAGLAAGTGWPFAELKLQRVRSIDVGEVAMPVYDISVEGTASFVADGVLVHNSGIEQMTIGFVIYTMLPWARRWEQQISKSLIGDARFFAEFLFDGLLRGDIKTRYEAYALAVQWGWMTRNEVRRLENLDPLPELDDPMTPVNMSVGGQPPAAGLKALMSGEDVAVVPDTPESQGLLEVLSREAAARLVRKEITAVSKNARKYADDPDGWGRWLTSFYDGHATEVSATLHIPERAARSYAREQQAAIERDGVGVVERWETWRADHLVGLMTA